MCKAIDDMIKEGRREGKREGRREGKREGRREGKREEKQFMSTMITHLLDADRIDDLRRAAKDAAYCQQIFQELGIR